MEKLIANSKLERGIIDGIENKSKERPAALDLEGVVETKSNAFRVKAARLAYEFDQKIKQEEQQAYLDGISSGKVRGKVKKAMEKSEQLELSGRAKSRYTMRRNQAMRAMIMDGVWCKELAKMYEITKEDVQVHHTEHIRITVFLNFTADYRFRAEIFDKAVKAFEIEKGKMDHYIEGTKAKGEKRMLRKLLALAEFERENVLPRLLIERKLFAKNEEGKSKIQVLHEELNAFYKRKNVLGEVEWLHKNETITEHFYKKGKKAVEDKLRKLQEENERFYNLYFLDPESNVNMTYIKAVGYKELEQYHNRMKEFEEDTTGQRLKPFHGISGIHVTSVAQGKKLIEEYCRWYNERFAEEIAAAKEQVEKQRSAEKNEKNRIKNRTVKLDRDRRIIELRENGERSAVRIAEIVDEKARTVREILSRYDNVIDLYRRGVTVPEAISEQLETKLTTVVHYIEIHTGESVETRTLTQIQQEQLELERQEEAQAREEMEEMEFRRIERKMVDERKKEREAEIIELHQKHGLSPSEIQRRNRGNSITYIKNVLRENNLTPHFDWKLVTDEERKQELNKRHLKEEEQAKARKKIDL